MGRRRHILATPQALAGRIARERMSVDERQLMNLRNRLRKYGLTIDEFRAMHEAQSGRCAICDESIDINADWRKRGGVHVDHDHVTGRVRGLLCCRAIRGCRTIGSSNYIMK
jgi:hypothetical protein